MVATVAAHPTVARKPRDHLVPIGFRLRHGTRRKYMHIGNFRPLLNKQLIAQ
jgi:hypothetical protein